jgi:hypothetical protein
MGNEKRREGDKGKKGTKEKEEDTKCIIPLEPQGAFPLLIHNNDTRHKGLERE